MLKVRRDDTQDGFTHHFGRRVAEKPFRGGIPGSDDTLERLTDDGIFRTGDDRREMRVSTLKLGGIGRTAMRGDGTKSFRRFRFKTHSKGVSRCSGGWDESTSSSVGSVRHFINPRRRTPQHRINDAPLHRLHHVLIEPRSPSAPSIKLLAPPRLGD